MHAVLKDEYRRKLGEADIDLDQRPTRVRLLDSERDMFLQWEGAVDDAGQIRKCLACGCSDLYAEKAFPQVTGFVIVLAFTGAALGVLGQNIPIPVLIGMSLVLVADVAILVFSKRRLVCYRCRSVYRDLSIARYHRSWDRATAEKYPPPSVPESELNEEVGAVAAASRGRNSENESDQGGGSMESDRGPSRQSDVASGRVQRTADADHFSWRAVP